VEDAVELLIRDFGYQRKAEREAKPRADGNGAGDWGDLAANLIDHDALASFAMRLLRSGMHDGAVHNFLRGAVNGLTDVDPERKQRRLDEIFGIVSSARRKLTAAADQSKADAECPDPHPLPDSLLAVAPFDLGLLPGEIRPWITDVCERMQCPPDFVTVAVMAALGSVIGRKLGIRPQVNNDWTVIPNQWALLIGRPRVLKSPAMEEALRPLRKLSVIAEERLKKELATFEITAAANKLRRYENMREAAKILRNNRKADVSLLLEADDPTEAPVLRRYIANNTNVASLGVLSQQNPNGLLVYRDEIVSLPDNLDREECVSERGFYLTGWNGDSWYTFDRIGRGLHLTVEGVCLSILGSTQLGRISQYLARAIRSGRGDDGLIQRFGLMVWPDVSRDWTNVDRGPERPARDMAFKLFARLDELDGRAVGGRCDRGPDGDEEGLPCLRFGIEAYECFVVWRTELELRLRGGELHVALESHLAKYRKLVPSLALLCHPAEGATGPVGVVSVRRAIGWAGYLETHVARAYGSVTAAFADTAKAILAKLQAGALRPEFTARDVWRPGWSRLTDRFQVGDALTLLLDYDWLTQRSAETGGRPTTAFTVSPKAMVRRI
jgi:putative DNA primase/helicase